MTSQEKNQLDSYMASLDRNERAKMMKRAAQLRKASVRKRPSTAYIDDEDDDAPPPLKAQRNLDDFIWRLMQAEERPEIAPTGRSGLVVEVARRSCKLLLDGAIVECQLTAELAAKQQSDIAVGDQAILREIGDTKVVVGTGPRRTKLSRPDVHKTVSERVIAANIDTVVVVVSVVSPPLHPRIIDRYLIAIQRGGCRAVLAVNKLDLLPEAEVDEELAKLACYEALGVPVVRCSANERRGMEELRSYLSGQLSAFVGHSGVGKSSLINALKPGLDLKVGDVSQGYGRGTHTTTSSTLLDLEDMRLIDTPGIRAFGLWQLSEGDLPWYFPEFALAGRCKFRDCTHTHEPQCAVKASTVHGTISKSRYETYLRIRETL